jgi:Ca2+-binding EF-hand superfamily protein
VAVEFGREPEGKELEGGEQEPEAGEGEAPAEPASEPSGPSMRLIRIAEHLAASGGAVVEQQGRLTLRVAGMTLTLYTNDAVAGGDFEANAKQALAMYDGNKDGYLETSEVPEGIQAQFGRFEAVDADEDGKIYLGEIMAYQSQQQAGLRAQIHAKASDRDDALFAVLDGDHDERLDSRELEAAGQTLAALDHNGDGLVTPDELPEAMVLGLARGSLENADALFVPPPVAARGPDADAPKWFTSMDANGDGAISKREFLGTAETFAELDASGNGLLEIDEAVTPWAADEPVAPTASNGQNAAISD